MEKKYNTTRETWGSKFGFLMATAGSAVGLGNIWKFPYLAKENGGAVFLFVYLIFMIIIGMAVMLAEFAVGRATHLNPIGAFRKLNPKYTWVGILMVIGIFLMLSYYSVVGGWIVTYMVISFKNFFYSSSVQVDYGNLFSKVISSPTESVSYLLIFLLINAAIVALGVRKGVEKTSKIMMPMLFIILILLVGRALTLDGAMEGVNFLLKPDFSQITPKLILSAMGQVFLSLSLGIGCLLTYGSYLKKEDNLIRYSFLIPIIDTCFSFVAGLMVMPALYSFGMQEKASGPGLIFCVLPEIFKKIPLGSFLMLLFFLLVLCAAVTSSLSMLEECVTFLVDEKQMKRFKASIMTILCAFVVGIPCALSFNKLSNISLMGKSIFDVMDFSICEVLMPVCGMLLCYFVGHIWHKPKLQNGDFDFTSGGPLGEVTNNGKIKFYFAKMWIFLIQYVTPLLIIIIFLSSIFSLFKK